MAEEQSPLQLHKDAQFSIQKVYVKDLSFETPHSPEVFKAKWQPRHGYAPYQRGQGAGR